MSEELHIGDSELPDDLKSLDAELSAIRYEERPSFGPELRAELARAWAEQESDRGAAPWTRHLIAAGLAALLLGGLAVPSARASFVRLIGVFSSEPAETEVEALRAPDPVSPDLGTEEVVTTPPEELPGEPAPIARPVVGETPVAVAEPMLVLPEMLDRSRSEQLLQEAYPIHLQRRGVGGTVWLRLRIDEAGLPGDVELSRSSGVQELDRVAVMVAPRFTFAPARQDGRPFGTWIEFPVVFDPDPALIERELGPVVDPLSLPTVPRAEWWQMREPLDLAELPSPVAAATAEARERTSAERSLEWALGDPALVERYGPTVALLEGEAPDGVAPTEWRTAVADALQGAVENGTATPAALLALGRIRIRQGLRTEARSLFERGLWMAVREDANESPWVVAELHYERATLLRDGWLAAEGVGRVDADAFSATSCAAARSTGDVEWGYASVDRLIAWNYLCPRELAGVFAEGFEPSRNGSAGGLTLMMASYRAALEAYPAHVGANTDLLVTLGMKDRWEDVLSGARRFTRVSGGHPNGLLLAGLALHGLGDLESAAARFEAALTRLPEEDAEEIRDVGILLNRAEGAAYRRLPLDERRSWEAGYWAARDRTPSTSLNERWVEHLARSSYAYLRYGGTFGDASEVWVRFGEPTTIHIVDEGSGRLTEFWDYGNGPDITFVRWVSSKRTDLTPEGRAYVDDLGKIFPPQ